VEWLSAFLTAFTGKLPVCSPQALANTLWALARLRTRPRGAWLDAAVGRAEALLPLARAEEQTSLLWALAELGYHPNQGWLARRALLPPPSPSASLSHARARRPSLRRRWGRAVPAHGEAVGGAHLPGRRWQGTDGVSTLL
jgi:hypothetical protein